MDAAERLRGIHLEDVQGRRVALASMRGTSLVLVYAGRSGADAAITVGRALEARLVGRAGPPTPRILPVACLGEVPAFFRGLARARIRSAAAGVEVLIDFERALERAIGMQPAVANIAVLDGGGSLVGVVTGVDESCVTQVELVIGRITAA